MPSLHSEFPVEKKELIKHLAAYARHPNLIKQDLDNLMHTGVPPVWQANKEAMHEKINDAWQKRQGITKESPLYTPLSKKSQDHSVKVSLEDIKNLLENYVDIRNVNERVAKINGDIKDLSSGASLQHFFREHGKENDARNLL